MEIKSVKIQGQGYLLNNEMSVPKADGNREYELIKEWLKDNTPEPEFTDEELASIELNKKIQEAKQYLGETDWITSKYHDKVTVGSMSKADFIAKYKAIYEARDEARKTINEVH